MFAVPHHLDKQAALNKECRAHKVTVFGIRQTEPASKLQQRILLPRQ
jgi:hypothetical protein